jgi:hypothetical protein
MILHLNYYNLNIQANKNFKLVVIKFSYLLLSTISQVNIPATWNGQE